MTGTVSNLEGRRAGERDCCERGRSVWVMDEIALAGKHGWVIPDTLIDQLPPWRANLYVTCAVQGGARLEHGATLEVLDAATRASSLMDPAAGWWSRYLAGQPETPRQRNTAPAAGRRP